MHDERLHQVYLKVERAKEHVADLQTELRSFLDSKPYGVAAKRDPETGKLVYYVARVEPTPDRLSLIAGDAIQCMKTALDHLAFQLVCSDTGDNPPDAGGIYFPIGASAEEYEASKGRRMKGASQETLEAIDGLKPYKGGNDLLWTLHRLNRIEKHRSLFMVGSQAAGVDLGQLTARMFEKMRPTLEKEGLPDDFIDGSIELSRKMHTYIMPADKGFPLEEGFELYIGQVDEEPDPNQQFRFEVAFDEPGVPEGQPIIETLHQLVNLVEGIVDALAHRLR